MRTVQYARAIVAAVAMVGSLSASAHGQSEDLARRMLENARGNLRDKRFADGVKALEQVIAQNAGSAVAADALLELATYHFGTSGDLAAAQTAAETLTTTYRQFTNPAASAWVMKGRILLTKTRDPQQMTTALSNFGSVATIYPTSESVPVATYYAGETLRLTGSYKSAIDRLRTVMSDYPTSPWAARALISAALCDVALGHHVAAMGALQRVRARFPGTSEAGTALSLNNQLYRLYLKPAAQLPSYEFTERLIPRGTAKLDDVNSLRVNGAGDVFASTDSRLLAYDTQGSARPAPSVLAPRGLFLDFDGTIAALQKGAISRAGVALPLRIPKPDGTPRILEDVSSGVAWSTGEYVVADPSGLLKFSRDGAPLGTLAPLRAERLAIDALDEVAALDRDTGITLFNRDGKSVRTIQKKAAAYELKRVVDLTFDSLGHLFVLDRGQSAVLVFGPAGAFLTTFTLPEKAAGAFRKAVALAVDDSGRLYIYDDGVKRILVYE